MGDGAGQEVSQAPETNQPSNAGYRQEQTGLPVVYVFGSNTPRKVKLATKVAADAWQAQTGVTFRHGRWNECTVIIVWCPRYAQRGLGMHYDWSHPWVGGPPGTLACTWTNPPYPAYIYVNASRAESERWKWELGDFGRERKRVALDGVLFHEFGHAAFNLHDIESGAVSLSDPYSNRDHWNSMWGRAFEGKLSLEDGDRAELQRVLGLGQPVLARGAYCEEGTKP